MAVNINLSDKSFCCPVCKKPLQQNQKSYVCSDNHLFDKAKSGYVNLLLSNQMNTKLPGDNKIMVHSRTLFLDKEYYKPLADKLCEVINALCKDDDLILDAGCGEGYYTNKVEKSLNTKVNFLGIDISKNALSVAAKRNNNIDYAVASIFHIPLNDNSVDIIFTLFAPFCRDEFNRIIKKGGKMIMVIPSENHLFELKQAIYEEPYKNEIKNTKIDGFIFDKSILVEDNIFLSCNEDIKNLFTMTPYYYKTSKEDTEKLDKLSSLKTKIGFEILIYTKK